MAQLVVRNIEDAVKARLRDRAARHGRSMEEEIRDILRNAARDETNAVPCLGSWIASVFAGLCFDEEIPEWRGEAARPAPFDP